MPKTLRIVLISFLVPLGVALLVGLAFLGDRWSNGGQVLGRVLVSGVDLGDLSRDDATAALRSLEEYLQTTPVPVTVAGHDFSLDPAAVSFEVDEAALVTQAMEQGREGHLGSQFVWWVRHFFGDEGRTLGLAYDYDEAALMDIVAQWELSGIDNPAFPGEVTVADGLVSFRYPQSGVGIERQQAAALLGAALADPARAAVDLPARELTPPLTEADIDAVVAEAEGLLAGDVTLHSIPVSSDLVIPAAVLGRSLLVHRDDTVSPPVFVVSWDPAPLQASLQPEVARLSTVPVNAELLIDITTDVVTIKPSLSTWEPDPEILPAAVDAAARAVGRTANLPYREGAEPEVTTADIEAMGVTGLIGEFTTNHHCCENRVTNIHLIAAATDGAVVLPGETFDLNAHVGQRTTAGGYVLAPAIIGGALECCDNPANVGGGTSQWTTTLYNAVFFAGLEDIDHQPHTEVISRYPEGREATLGWPVPNLVFRNNTGHVVIIRSTYTDTSVTAKIYGDNGGIKVEAGLGGEPVSAEVAMSIPAWNQAASQHRHNFSGMVTRYERNPDLPCGTEQVKSGGTGGWSIDYQRFITYPDGRRTTEEWTWHYPGLTEVIERGPACPDPAP